jgi:hypothetical protein
MKTKQELKEIKVLAEHYHLPITDIKGFNLLLKENGYKGVRRETLRKLLNY